MIKLGSAFGVLVAVGCVAAGLAQPVQAAPTTELARAVAAVAPPGADDVANALTVKLSQLPTKIQIDTTEATTSPTDPAVDLDGRPCMGDRSVWLRLNPTKAVTARILVAQDSTAIVGVFHFVGDLEPVACNDFTTIPNDWTGVDYDFEAGQKYFVAVSTCCGAPGGPTRIRLLTPVKMTFQAHVVRAVADASSGEAVVSGDIACANPAAGTALAKIWQRQGIHNARGESAGQFSCGFGGVGTWTVRVGSSTGIPFRPGRAVVRVVIGVFDGFTGRVSHQAAGSGVVVFGGHPRGASRVRAAPANDELADATRVTSARLPFFDNTSTAHATTDPTTDVPSIDTGGVPCMGTHSIWYRFTATSDETVRIMASEVGFDALVGVFTRGVFNELDPAQCSDQAPAAAQHAEDAGVEIAVTSGTTYFVAVSSCCDPTTGGAGGDTGVRMYVPKPLVSKTPLTSVKVGDVSGIVFAVGTYTCSHYTPWLVIQLGIAEGDDDHLAQGGDTIYAYECNGKPQTWRMQVDSSTAFAFLPGKARALVSVQRDDAFEVTTRTRNVHVTLVKRLNAKH